MDVNKCPYCFRPSGTWQKDPILLPNGSPLVWNSDTELILEPDIKKRLYIGTYQVSEPEIQEIQDRLKASEVENGITPLTVFSPLNISGKFQITGQHIKEMRDSVEKSLTTLGLTKIDYFNYDEDSNHIIQPSGDKIEWTGPVIKSTDLKNFQIKAIHIEELRHYISQIWLETWTSASTVDSLNLMEEYYGASNPILNSSSGIISGDYTWNYQIRAGASTTLGANWATVNPQVTIGPNFNFAGYAKSDPKYANYCYGISYSYFTCNHVFEHPITISTNLHFIISDLILSYSRLSGATRGVAGTAPMPQFYVRFTDSALHRWSYCWGEWGRRDYPPNYTLISNQPIHNGEFNRNLYDDFYSFWGEPSGRTITRIDIYMYSYGQGVDTYYVPRNTWWSESTLNVSFDDITIRSVSPTP